MNLISFSIVYLVPVSVVAGYLLGGMYTFLTPVFIFAIVPILDLIIGKDTRNPDAETEKMLGTVLYVHWGLEHVVGHHRRVATPEDPATARLGESFYAFWPRTVFGGFNSAWEFEAGRMKKQGLPVWSRHNPMSVAILFQTIYVIFIAVLFGGMGVFYIFAQSLIAISLLEIVNYVEHYGLLRNKVAPGKYEPVRPWHSWKSSNWLTNRFLFNLQRHSDHHFRPGRRYQLLRHYGESPQLPTGYAGMIIVAAIPPLWRKTMDPRIKEFQKPQEK